MPRPPLLEPDAGTAWFVRGGGLGDLLVTLPAWAILSRALPGRRWTYVGDPRWAPLVVGPGRPFAAFEDLGGPVWARRLDPDQPEAAEFWTQVSLAWSSTPDADARLRGLWSAAGLTVNPGSPPTRAERALFWATPQPTSGPAGRHFAQPLERAGLGPVVPWFRLPGAEPDDQLRRRSPLVALHPGSGSAAKNAPASWWRALAAAVRSWGLQPLWILGEVEASRGWDGPPEPSDRALRQQPLPVVAEHLGAVRHFVGHDSGVAHLAAACGCPCTLLFGPTQPEVWAPPQPWVRVLPLSPAPEPAELQSRIKT